MPVVATNLSPKLYSAIRRMIAEGKYESPDQFLEIAIFNQVALEDGKAKGIEVLDKLQADAGEQPAGQNGQPGTSRRTSGKDEDRTIRDARARLALGRWTDSLPSPAEVIQDGAGERIWGQVNRLFTLKLACRWLAINAAEHCEWPRLRDVSDQLADDAAAIGTLLVKHDESLGLKREARLSTGLPRKGNSASRDRYLCQYVARTTRSGEIHPGAICQLALAYVEFDEVRLTTAGAELARLENPILDCPLTAATSTLSESERLFLQEHIQLHATEERRDIDLTLHALLANNTKPNALAEVLSPQLPEAWSDVAKRTHIAGVLARMTDLGLLRRIWEGRNVTYDLSPLDSSRWRLDETTEPGTDALQSAKELPK